MVSIRSPCRSKGRSADSRESIRAAEFQSAPPAEARGDVDPSILSKFRTMFQSAPPAEARGDRWPNRKSGTSALCFNPLPLPKQGEISFALLGGNVLDVGVSIRSPCRSKGRSTTDGVTSQCVGCFNPLPHAEARGDIPCSPMFQSAPPAEASGDDLSDQCVGSKGRSEGVSAARVSIRSPCRSKGRSDEWAQVRSMIPGRFQSAPPAEARGDPQPRAGRTDT